MSEPIRDKSDDSPPSDSADKPRTQAVKPIKSYRVRELPPPPKIEERAAGASAGTVGEADQGHPIAGSALPANEDLLDEGLNLQAVSPAPWRPRAAGRQWRMVACTILAGLMFLGVVVAAWRQAMRPVTSARGAASQAAPAETSGSKEANDARVARAAPVKGVVTPPLPKVELSAKPESTPRPPSVSETLPVQPRAAAPRLPPVAVPSSPKTPRARPEPIEDTPQPRVETKEDWLRAAEALVQGKLNGRNPAHRSEAVNYGLASTKSELAVEAGLKWLLSHQRDDGSWRFNHAVDACMHYCSHPGSEASTTAATSLALLPFLGAGYTHKQGEYQDSVQRGLDYLRSRAITISYGNDLRDGSMYGQALATIALCEAYGMTEDPALKDLAQEALRFCVYCQDTKSGGWRYTPGEPGDTTVTGWMLMALKSGQMARLEVPTPSVFSAERFLSSVQNADGSQYGYMTRQPKQTTTAVALLCRMYTGWRRDNPALQKGIGHLSGWGPQPDNLYFNYYATQAMFHFGGPPWETWNKKMRDYLVERQDRAGHASGSWYFPDSYGDRGGRLYNTAMAILILEVYYRYLPLYREKAVEKGF